MNPFLAYLLGFLTPVLAIFAVAVYRIASGAAGPNSRENVSENVVSVLKEKDDVD